MKVRFWRETHRYARMIDNNRPTDLKINRESGTVLIAKDELRAGQNHYECEMPSQKVTLATLDRTLSSYTHFVSL